MTEQEQLDLREAVLMLRYGFTKDDRKKKLLKSFTQIAYALSISYNLVRHVCGYKYIPVKKRKYSAAVWKL
jgi:hypothetical protein